MPLKADSKFTTDHRVLQTTSDILCNNYQVKPLPFIALDDDPFHVNFLHNKKINKTRLDCSKILIMNYLSQ